MSVILNQAATMPPTSTGAGARPSNAQNAAGYAAATNASKVAKVAAAGPAKIEDRPKSAYGAPDNSYTSAARLLAGTKENVLHLMHAVDLRVDLSRFRLMRNSCGDVKKKIKENEKVMNEYFQATNDQSYLTMLQKLTQGLRDKFLPQTAPQVVLAPTPS